MHRDQRCCAGCVYGITGPPQVEFVGYSRGKTSEIVSQTDFKGAYRACNFGVGIQIEQVTARSCAGIDSDRSFVGVRIVTGVLQGPPGTLQQEAMLRIHDASFICRYAEE